MGNSVIRTKKISEVRGNKKIVATIEIYDSKFSDFLHIKAKFTRPGWSTNSGVPFKFEMEERLDKSKGLDHVLKGIQDVENQVTGRISACFERQEVAKLPELAKKLSQKGYKVENATILPKKSSKK